MVNENGRRGPQTKRAPPESAWRIKGDEWKPRITRLENRGEESQLKRLVGLARRVAGQDWSFWRGLSVDQTVSGWSARPTLRFVGWAMGMFGRCEKAKNRNENAGYFCPVLRE